MEDSAKDEMQPTDVSHRDQADAAHEAVGTHNGNVAVDAPDPTGPTRPFLHLRWVHKPKGYTFDKYTKLQARPRITLEHVEKAIQLAVVAAISKRKSVTVEQSDIEARKENGYWLCFQCCPAMRLLRIWGVFQLVNDSLRGELETLPGESGHPLAYVLRRHHDKVGIEVEADRIEWARVDYVHSGYCWVSPGRKVSAPGEIEQRAGSAPPVDRASPGDFRVSVKRPSGKITVRPPPGRPNVREQRLRQSAQDRMRRFKSRAQLMTWLDDAGLLDMVPDHTLEHAAEALGAALAKRVPVGLPREVAVSDTAFIFPTNAVDEVKRRLVELQCHWPEGEKALLPVVLMIASCSPPSSGLREASCLALDGSLDKVSLPRSVKVWAGDAGPAREPFIGLVFFHLDSAGEPKIRRGYIHPCYSTQSPVPFESDDERCILMPLRYWHNNIPQEMECTVRVKKCEFSVRVAGHNIILDALIELCLPNGNWIVVAYVEHLGCFKQGYLATKRLEHDLLSPYYEILYSWSGELKIPKEDLWFEAIPFSEQLALLLVKLRALMR